MFRRFFPFLKKSGKPLETPDYKQVYLPYEKAPTEREVEAAKNQFSTCPDHTASYQKRIRVLDVPKNMYCYGKEGMTVPISIFKDQDDPVIGPEHTYPGIYELKLALRHNTTAELMEMEDNDTFKSPWQKDILHDQLDAKEEVMNKKMQVMRYRHYLTKYQKDRATGAAKVTKAAGAADPDKGKAKK